MSEKTCSECGCTFYGDDIRENFNRHPQTDDGLRPDCKVCQGNGFSIYYLNNRADLLERRWQNYHDPQKHEANKAYFAQKARERRARLREQVAASA